MDTPDRVLSQFVAVTEEIKEYVSQCLERHGPGVKGFKADLRLDGDPDVGTLIDASALVGIDGAPLPAEFDDCVRAQMQTLELPPMKTGDGFSVTYEFEF